MYALQSIVHKFALYANPSLTGGRGEIRTPVGLAAPKVFETWPIIRSGTLPRSTPGRARTCDLQIRNLTFCPTELRALAIGNYSSLIKSWKLEIYSRLILSCRKLAHLSNKECTGPS